MTINRTSKYRVPIILLLCAFLSAQLCFWILPNVFEIWNSLTVDQLFVLRSKSEKLHPAYNNTVVHVDFNNSSIERLENQYINRSQITQVINNLKAMGVSAQVFDFIFAARLNEEDDLNLINATKKAGNVYFGLAFQLRKQDQNLQKK